jgi:hypothetical protein
MELVPGAHYFKDSETHREAAIDLTAAWIKDRP